MVGFGLASMTRPKKSRLIFSFLMAWPQAGGRGWGDEHGSRGTSRIRAYVGMRRTDRLGSNTVAEHLVCSYDCLLTFVTWRAVEEMPIRAAMNASISSWLLVVP